MTFDARGQDSPTFQRQPVEQQIDMVCDEFEAAWQSGKTARAEDFLTGLAEPSRSALLQELLALEIDYRRRGDGIERAELLGRFPADAALIDKLLPPAPAQPVGPGLGTFGQYRLLAKIGEGGMGTVYKAMHTRLEKIVAVKVLSASGTRDPAVLARFDREMKAVGRLEHQNIVGAHDAGEAAGVHFLVMEYVDGINLDQLLERHGPLAVSDACELIRQAAIGLQEAHEHGMVHRDIKPSNLMLTVQRRKKKLRGVVKILDLGLAFLADQKRNGELTVTGQLMGTIDYMSPEQVESSRRAEIRSDVYSLGVTLYKLLCGHTPFADLKHASLRKRLQAVVSLPPPPIAGLRPDLPPEVAALVDRMLAKNAADRPATPEEVAEALTPFADSLNLAALMPGDADSHTSLNLSDSTRSTQFQETAKISVHPTSPPDQATTLVAATAPTKVAEPQPQPSQRQLAWPAIAGALLALTAGAVGLGWWLGNRGEPVVAPDRNRVIEAVPQPPDEPDKPPVVELQELRNTSAYEWSEPVNLGPGVNTARWDEHPKLARDGLTLWYSGNGAFWTAQRDTLDATFGPREPFALTIEDREAWDSEPTLSLDWRVLVFSSGRQSQREKDVDLWMAVRESSDVPFLSAQRLEAVSSPTSEVTPFISDDGLQLYFSSARRGGAGSMDLWVSRRADLDEPFDAPESLGPGVNSPQLDRGPWVSDDGLVLLFDSDRPGGLGGFDLWMCTRDSTADDFGPAQWCGDRVNSAQIDASPFYCSAMQAVLFHSNRPGGHGEADLWMSRRVPKPSAP